MELGLEIYKKNTYKSGEEPRCSDVLQGIRDAEGEGKQQARKEEHITCIMN